MNKWDMPNGEFWEDWFKEAFRSLKHGGYCIMYGIDRQTFMFKYYANMAGFNEQQSMYWYFISSFPKSVDLSKNLDKHFGEKREVVGVEDSRSKYDGSNRSDMTSELSELSKMGGAERGSHDVTIPTSELAKKYDGYKYSVSPLKQTCEEIMIFQKPYKTGSCLHDVVKMEEGDETCTCGALNVDGCRVSLTENDKKNIKDYKDYLNVDDDKDGRYPSQTFVDGEIDKILKEQNDISRILDKVDYVKNEHDLYIYHPKVYASERNAGLEEFEDVDKAGEYCLSYHNGEKRLDDAMKVKNNHPTLKPIELNYKVLKLFKSPNNQKIIYPFAGSGSEIIGGEKAGFDCWEASELSEEWEAIAKARIKHWRSIGYDLTNTQKIDNNDFLDNL